MKLKTVPFLVTVLLMTMTSVVLAQTVDTSTALYFSNLRVANTESAIEGISKPFGFSGQSLVNQNFINPDGLNSVVVGTDGSIVPSMPASVQIDVESCKLFDSVATSFTDYTTECTDSTVGDIDLSTATPVADDAFLFGLHEPGRIITFSVSQGAVWDAVLTYFYWNGSAWFPLEEVEDSSDAFANEGTNSVTFKLPHDWVEATVDGDAAYWVRADITSVSSTITLPKGTQAWWQNGNWWSFVDSIGQNEQINYTLFLGGTTDLQTHHAFFPGDDGIVTLDDASIELGIDYLVQIEGYLDTASDTADKNVIFKDSAIRLYVSGEEEVTLALNGSDVITLSSVPSDHYNIDILSNTDTVTLTVGEFSDSATSVTVTDNSISWNWATNGSLEYFERIAIVFPSQESLITQQEWINGTEINTGTGLNVNLNEPNFTCVGENSDTGSSRKIISYDHVNDEILLAHINSNVIRRLDPLDCTQNGTVSYTSPWDATFEGPNYWITNGSDVQEVQSDGTIVTTLTPGYTIRGVAHATPSDDLYVLDTTNDLIRRIDQSTGSSLASFSVYPLTEEDGMVLSSFDGRGLSYFDDRLYYTWWINPNNSGTRFRGRTFCWEVTTDGEHIQSVSDNLDYMHDKSCAKVDSATIAIGGSQENGGTCCGSEPQVGRPDGTIRFFPISDIDRGINATFAFGAAVCARTWSCGGSGISTASGFTIASDTVDGSLAWFSRPTGSSPDYFTFQRQEASEGQVWSGSGAFKVIRDPSFGGLVIREVTIRFLDESFTQLQSNQTTSATGSPGDYTTITLNNQTAPANTAWVELRLGWDGSGTATGWYGGIDAAMLCICASAPSYPDPSNELRDPGFEGWYDNDGTYTSPNFNFPTATSVESSKIQWIESVPSGATVTTEISDDGINWTPINNGDPFATEGSDISSTNWQVRFTLEGDRLITAEVRSLQLLVTDDDDGTLEYQLETLPSLTLSDNSGNGNDGTVSFPLDTATGVTSSAGELQATQGVENKQDQSLSPDVVSEVTPTDPTASEFDGSGIPFNAVFVALSEITGGDIPPIVYWVVFATWVVLLAGLITFIFTQSVAWSAAVMGIFMLGFVNFGDTGAGGLIPQWVFFFFGIMAMAASIWQKVRAM